MAEGKTKVGDAGWKPESNPRAAIMRLDKGQNAPESKRISISSRAAGDDLVRKLHDLGFEEPRRR
ncbi:hypothetical protein [Candidatus Solirubrobacter pratensis]|uniref:hypothetical protein n=1 Tax=Candidatus Solirubrobacter pratensis TaxID=1298857 RepID=UPI000410EAFD|nr:hypothetical protein [Candidatus Solirubrobacter pratensis]